MLAFLAESAGIVICVAVIAFGLFCWWVTKTFGSGT